MAEEKKRPDLQEAFKEVLNVLRAPPEPGGELENMDLEEVIERLEDALGTLNVEMEKIYDKTGTSREQMEEYAHNPDNFSKDEWNLLNEVRDELTLFEKEAEGALGPKTLEAPAGEHEVAEKKPKKKGPKGKKGWKRA